MRIYDLIRSAVSNGDVKHAEDLLSTPDAIDWDAEDSQDEPLLHFAAQRDYSNLLRLLLSGNGVLHANDLERDFLYTPLMVAAAEGNSRSAAVLLDSGASIDFVSGSGEYTALLLAIKNGRESMVSQLLSRGADPMRRGYLGKNACELALHFFSESRDPAFRRILAMIHKAGGERFVSCLPIGVSPEDL